MPNQTRALTKSWAMSLLLTAWCPAQEWSCALPPARIAHAMAYDATIGRTVLFGGSDFQAGLSNETHLFDGTKWTPVRSTNRPSARSGHAMAFDTLRGRTVLFGGWDGSNLLGDTWEFDGAQWSQRNVAGPQVRSGHAMAYDSVRGRIVLFGGATRIANTDVQLLDTWEFDGNSWLQIALIASPPARFGHALAHDAVRGRTVLFGGTGTTGELGDTWEYDGITWTQAMTPNAPSPRFQTAIAYDLPRSRIVLFGGATQAGITLASLADTWEFDGVQWTQPATAIAATRAGHAMAYDLGRGRTVCFAGVHWAWTGNEPRADTVEFDGVQWTQVPTADWPTPRIGHDMVHDPFRDRTVLFGGTLRRGFINVIHGDTWEFGDGRWTRVTAGAVVPGGRLGHAMSFDSGRRRVVLFGGLSGASLADTWEYDGQQWFAITTTTSPLARHWHDAAYDPVRRRTVLFGGFNSVALGDTWEFDGQQWQQVATATAPSARFGHRMAHDARRGRVVLFGGTDATGDRNDTWEFTGSNWNPVAAANPPPVGAGQALVDDPVLGRLLLFVTGPDVWQLQGSAWAQTVLNGPAARAGHAAACSWSTGRVVLFGGGTISQQRDDTWEFVPPDVASFARHGTGCPGSAGIPQLDRVGAAVPALGTTFTVNITALPPAATFAMLGGGTEVVQWAGSALPIALAPFGLPGCTLWVGPDVQIMVPANNGVATLSVPIPALSTLAGMRLGLQALSLDPATASGLGAVSNGAILRLH